MTLKLIINNYSIIILIMIRQEICVKVEEKEREEDEWMDFSRGPFISAKGAGERNEKRTKISEWRDEEIQKYMIFIENNCEKMGSQPHRKLWGVYKEISGFVGSRNFRQCKIYHQKLLNKFHTIPNILKFLKGKFMERSLDFQSLQASYQQFHRSKIDSHKTIPQLGCEEKLKSKDDLPPTDSRYQNQAEQYIQVPYPTFFAQPTNMFGSNYMVHFDKQASMDESMRSTVARQRESDVRECHECFLKWMTCLNKLISASSRN